MSTKYYISLNGNSGYVGTYVKVWEGTRDGWLRFASKTMQPNYCEVYTNEEYQLLEDYPNKVIDIADYFELFPPE